jgi:uncharacterized protein (DUF433 family)
MCRIVPMPERATEYVSGELYEYYPLGKYVVRAKGVCGGKPTFKYTRIEIAGTLSRIASGETIDAVVEGYRGRVSRQAILEAIDIADKLGKKINEKLSKRAAAQ